VDKKLSVKLDYQSKVAGVSSDAIDKSPASIHASIKKATHQYKQTRQQQQKLIM
jgi:hypothetical protein